MHLMMTTGGCKHGTERAYSHSSHWQLFQDPNDIIDTHGRTLGAIGIGVYAALARYADRKTGECWPGIAKLERVLDLARSTVKVYLHKLEALGLIAIEKRWDAAGDPTTNQYAARSVANRDYQTPCGTCGLEGTSTGAH